MTEENNEVDVTHDALIDQIEARMKEEYARSSDASESAAKVKEFLEETNLNSQAFSWLKSILKKLPKKDGQAKAMDVIRSLRVGLDMVEDHVKGQGTVEMDLESEDSADDGSEDATPDNVEPFKSDEPVAAE